MPKKPNTRKKNYSKQKKKAPKRRFQCFKRNKSIRRIKLEWRELNFTSKMILLIGFVLLTELILCIFIIHYKTDSSINIVFRTGLSSVLGYLLGMGNAPNPSSDSHLPSSPHSSDPHLSSSTSRPSVVSSQKDTFDDLPSMNDIECEADKISIQNASHLRALIATTVCLVCIITLVAANFTDQLAYQEGIIQVRDLISTAIGFLISKSNRGH